MFVFYRLQQTANPLPMQVTRHDTPRPLLRTSGGWASGAATMRGRLPWRRWPAGRRSSGPWWGGGDLRRRRLHVQRRPRSRMGEGWVAPASQTPLL